MDPVPDEGRSARKRRAILDAARAAFLEHGYGGTTMDHVAAAAAVSKQTVYKHFTDKQRLFTEIITSDIELAEQQSHDLVEALADTTDLDEDLRRFARLHVTTVMQPHLVQLRRLIISEADRFPDLAHTWYTAGPERGHTTLAALFTALTRRGLLRVDDARLAAQHFNWLVLSIPLNEAMFRPTKFTRRRLHHYADQGVHVFLSAYR